MNNMTCHQGIEQEGCGQSAMKRFACLVIAGFLLAGFTVMPASAAILADFEAPGYSLGNLNDQNGWVTSNMSVVEGGLTYAQGSVIHGGGAQHVERVGGGTARTHLPLDFEIKPGETVYFSFLYRHALNAANFAWFAFSDTSANDNNSIGAIVDHSTGQFGARVRDNSTNTNDLTGILGTTGEVFLVVGKIEYNLAGQDTISVLINPTSTLEPESWHASASRTLNKNPLNTLWMRAGDAGGDRDFDEIRFGDSFQAVVIPEPGTLALLLLAGAGVLASGIRRRR